MENNEYGHVWGEPIQAPPQRQVQNSFTIHTTEQLRSSTQDKSCVYAEVSKPKKEGVSRENNEHQVEVVPGVINSSIDFNVFLVETAEKKVKGVLELSTLHHDIIDKVQTRIVCLFDTSGSMLLSCGRTRKESKLTKLKKMASQLIDALEDDEDYLGLVTFGEKATVILPLSKVTQNTRETTKASIENMNEKLSSHTDLSSGLIAAIDMLHQQDDHTKYMYRNAIIVFSDGEINKGTTVPDSLVHETREKIRQTKPSLELQSDQWLSISCVTTGGNVSEAMYLLSKFCGNDAYFYVDNRALNPELDMMVPFMLRKSSVAQFITLKIVTENGIELDTRNCTQEHCIRRPRQSSVNSKMSYYLHDFPAGHQKHFSICLDLGYFNRGISGGLLKLELEYVDNWGNIRSIFKHIQQTDILTQKANSSHFDKGLSAVAKSDMRSAMQLACRKSAEIISQHSSDNAALALDDGAVEIHRLRDQHMNMAQLEETKSHIREYSTALTQNLDSLKDTVNKSIQGDGHKWTKLKAVSSSIARQCPNVANLVSEGATLCPLPEVKDCVSKRLAVLAKKIFEEQHAESELIANSARLMSAVSSTAQSLGTLLHSTLNRSAADHRLMMTMDDGLDNEDSSSSASDSDGEYVTINKP